MRWLKKRTLQHSNQETAHFMPAFSYALMTLVDRDAEGKRYRLLSGTGDGRWAFRTEHPQQDTTSHTIRNTSAAMGML